MEKHNHDMRNLVANIRAGIMQRRERLGTITSETRDRLRAYQAERSEEADALRARAMDVRKHLSALRDERMKRFRQTKLDIAGPRRHAAQVAEQRRVSVSEIRSAANSRIKRHHLERNEEAKSEMELLHDVVAEVRRSVADARSSMRDSMLEITKERKQAMSALRESLASGREALKPANEMLHEMVDVFRDELQQLNAEAHALWSELSAESPRVAKPSAKRAEKPSPGERMEMAEQPDSDDIYAVIAKHPDGIRLMDIGADLDVEWRSLTGLVRGLVEEGRVEKIESRYFPK